MKAARQILHESRPHRGKRTWARWSSSGPRPVNRTDWKAIVRAGIDGGLVKKPSPPPTP
jgi:hypothetical protein